MIKEEKYRPIEEIVVDLKEADEERKKIENKVKNILENLKI